MTATDRNERTREELGEKINDFLDELYELGFHSALPQLSVEAGFLNRAEGDDTPRDCDYTIWKFDNLLKDLLSLLNENSEEDADAIEQWRLYFIKCAAVCEKAVKYKRRRIPKNI